MDTTTDIKRDIRSFLIDNFLSGRGEELTDDESLQGNVIDSTGVLELVTFLQERFSITVEDEEVVADNINSVNDIVRFLIAKLRSNAEGRVPR
jgi:acyl carrier protein